MACQGITVRHNCITVGLGFAVSTWLADVVCGAKAWMFRKAPQLKILVAGINECMSFAGMHVICNVLWVEWRVAATGFGNLSFLRVGGPRYQQQ